MILQQHILKVIGVRVLAALVILVSILQILDLLEVTTDILDRRLGVGGVVYYSLLRTPTLIQQVAPLAVLSGALFAFAQLSRENAVTAMRSAGMSVYRLVGIAAPVAVAMALLHALSGLVIAPAADQALDSWWSKSTPVAKQVVKEPRSFRVGRDIVTATLADDDGAKLSGVGIYRRDAGGRLVERIYAASAVYVQGAWKLVSPRFEAVAPSAVKSGEATEMGWPGGPRPQDVRATFSDDPGLAPGVAQRALKGGVSTMPSSYYKTQLQRGLAAPIGALVMLLLAAPVALSNLRSGGATLLVACLGAGLMFMVADGMFTAMGEGGDVPAILAAWAAPLIFATLAAAALLHMEQ